MQKKNLPAAVPSFLDEMLAVTESLISVTANWTEHVNVHVFSEYHYKTTAAQN